VNEKPRRFTHTYRIDEPLWDPEIQEAIEARKKSESAFLDAMRKLITNTLVDQNDDTPKETK
jgi:hypothetical protein